MARLDPLSRFVPSLLDRLIDPVADSADADRRRGYSLQQMLDAIRGDIEELLNTRQTGDFDPDLTRVNRSMLGFGLPDLVSLNAVTPEQKSDIADQIAAVIARYEPRLHGVRVTLLEAVVGDPRTLRCRIEARFAMDPAPDVTFDSVMEVTTGHHTVVRKDA